MSFEYQNAFELIAGRVEDALLKSGCTRQKVSAENENDLVALFTGENVAYSVLYEKEKHLMQLRTCPMTDDGPDNEWKTLATWLYDDSEATQKDAESIANDFVDGVSNTGAVKQESVPRWQAGPSFSTTTSSASRSQSAVMETMCW